MRVSAVRPCAFSLILATISSRAALYAVSLAAVSIICSLRPRCSICLTVSTRSRNSLTVISLYDLRNAASSISGAMSGSSPASFCDSTQSARLRRSAISFRVIAFSSKRDSRSSIWSEWSAPMRWRFLSDVTLRRYSRPFWISTITDEASAVSWLFSRADCKAVVTPVASPLLIAALASRLARTSAILN